MSKMENWPQYVRRAARGLKQEQIAERTGISQATISAWLRGAPAAPKAETVIAFAKSFGQSPVKALVIAGYLDRADADLSARSPLSEYSSSELFDELRSRSPD
jgi:transcriptional regulator with XRE-family HTH domain